MSAPHARSPHRRRVVRALWILAAFVAGGVVLLWSWNTLAVGLFAAPAVEFKHALAAELAISVAFAIAAWSVRLARPRQARETSHEPA